MPVLKHVFKSNAFPFLMADKTLFSGMLAKVEVKNVTKRLGLLVVKNSQWHGKSFNLSSMASNLFYALAMVDHRNSSALCVVPLLNRYIMET